MMTKDDPNDQDPWLSLADAVAMTEDNETIEFDIQQIVFEPALQDFDFDS